MLTTTTDIETTRDIKCAEHAGLCAGTSVLTQRGEVAIESLRTGDRVITRDAGLVAVKSISRHDVTTPIVMIKAGSLGHTRPDKDTIMPSGTFVHIRDWRAPAIFGQKTANVAIDRLIDGEFVSLKGPETVGVFQIHLGSQHVLYADGIEMLSAEV